MDILFVCQSVVFLGNIKSYYQECANVHLVFTGIDSAIYKNLRHDDDRFACDAIVCIKFLHRNFF